MGELLDQWLQLNYSWLFHNVRAAVTTQVDITTNQISAQMYKAGIPNQIAGSSAEPSINIEPGPGPRSRANRKIIVKVRPSFDIW